MSDHAHDIQKEIKGYLIVGTSLLALTLVTVAISYLHLQLTEAIIVALFVAIVKGSLVACYFMHLISEQRLIYIVLAITAFFFAGMMGLIVSGQQEHIFGTKMYHPAVTTAAPEHH